MSRSNHISNHQLINLYRQAVRRNLSLDKLNQKISKKITRSEVSQKIEQQQEQQRVSQMKQGLPKMIRFTALLVPLVFIGVGVFLLSNAVLPIAQHYLPSFSQISEQRFLAPVPKEEVLDVTPWVVAQAETLSSVLGSHVQSTSNSGPVILDTELDYTNLSNWFNDERGQALQNTDSDTKYLLKIPKLEIEQAEVEIGGIDLDKNLIAYPGTALPGERGAPVIFGHSVLRQFYNPSLKNPRRYNSIFSYIMTLERGDPIYLSYDGATYKYEVETKTEVKPEDTYILEQQHDARKLKLVTCVPEGTYLRRGVVTARLVAN